MRLVTQSLIGGLNTAGCPSPSACLCSRVPATLPEPGLLQPAPALRVPLRLPRSPLRRGHSGGGIRPPELQASTPTLGRGTPQPAQEQCGQRKHHGQSAAPSATAAAGQVSPLPQWALPSLGEGGCAASLGGLLPSACLVKTLVEKAGGTLLPSPSPTRGVTNRSAGFGVGTGSGRLDCMVEVGGELLPSRSWEKDEEGMCLDPGSLLSNPGCHFLGG